MRYYPEEMGDRIEAIAFYSGARRVFSRDGRLGLLPEVRISVESHIRRHYYQSHHRRSRVSSVFSGKSLDYK